MNIKEIKTTTDGKPFVIRTINDYNNLSIRMKWDGCIDIVIGLALIERRCRNVKERNCLS